MPMRPRLIPLALALVVTVLCAPAAAGAQRGAPSLLSVHCLRSCVDARTVAPGGLLRITGRNFSRPLRAVFLTGTSRVRRSAPVKVLTRSKASVTVPRNAAGGVLYVRDRGGRRSNRVRPIRVAPRARTAPGAGDGSAGAPAPTGTAFDGNGMWIWYVARAGGGDPQAIAAQARAAGVSTLFIKSADGTSAWAQFSPQFVATLKAAGLRVCGWQYVYGTRPEAEAQAAAQAVTAGADCFVIDAETEYEGRYAQAQRYVSALRRAIGPDFPVGFTSFPYVHYHPALPYSVFLGPGGAQFNAPQIYWKDIGGGVDAVTDTAYRYNRPYARPIVPVGQLYERPPAGEIMRWRQLAAASGSTGLSWWSWQHARPADWAEIARPLTPPDAPTPAPEYATLARGAKGDIVVWAQQHLNGAGQDIPVTGRFDAATQLAVQAFQTVAVLPATGVVDTATWLAILRADPRPVDWTAGVARTARAARAARDRGRTGPPTAHMRARAYEVGP